MKKIFKGSERGSTRLGWLDSRHSFSFGGYYDPDRMGFGPLRVINDDRIAPSGGFPMHPHKDMEIFSYVTEGQLAHEDSLGNGATIGPGRLQFMGAGSGVRHSEFNPSPKEETRLLQIWLEPSENNLPPTYSELDYADEDRLNAWVTLLSPAGLSGGMAIRQQATVKTALLAEGETLEVETGGATKLYLHVVDGEVAFAGEHLSGGDAIGIEEPKDGPVTARANSDLLLFLMD